MAEIRHEIRLSHPALDCTEVLEAIFKYADNHTLSQCIRVCKAWFSPAADVLWKELTDVRPVLEILITPLELLSILQPYEVRTVFKFPHKFNHCGMKLLSHSHTPSDPKEKTR